jgi:hypothetical protein
MQLFREVRHPESPRFAVVNFPPKSLTLLDSSNPDYDRYLTSQVTSQVPVRYHTLI